MTSTLPQQAVLLDDLSPAERRQVDRQGYLTATRLATELRNEAARIRRNAAHTEANPEPRFEHLAPKIAQGISARAEVTACFLDYEADQQDIIAADYRAHLLGER